MNGLIIDIHDVLIDSRGVRAQAWREACKYCGFEVSLDFVRQNLDYPQNTALINTIGIGLGSPDGKRIYERYLYLLEHRFIHRVIAPLEVDKFLAVLKNVGRSRQVGLVSEEPSKLLMRYLHAAGADFLFQELPEEECTSGLFSFRNELQSAVERMNMSPQSSVLITANASRAHAAQQLNIPVVLITAQAIKNDGTYGVLRQYRTTRELSDLFYKEVAPLLVQ